MRRSVRSCFLFAWRAGHRVRRRPPSSSAQGFWGSLVRAIGERQGRAAALDHAARHDHAAARAGIPFRHRVAAEARRHVDRELRRRQGARADSVRTRRGHRRPSGLRGARRAPAQNGFGDLRLLVKYRLAARDEASGAYIVTAFCRRQRADRIRGEWRVPSGRHGDDGVRQRVRPLRSAGHARVRHADERGRGARPDGRVEQRRPVSAVPAASGPRSRSTRRSSIGGERRPAADVRDARARRRPSAARGAARV